VWIPSLEREIELCLSRHFKLGKAAPQRGPKSSKRKVYCFQARRTAFTRKGPVMGYGSWARIARGRDNSVSEGF